MQQGGKISLSCVVDDSVLLVGCAMKCYQDVIVVCLVESTDLTI